MSRTQRFFMWLMPQSIGQAMEQESRQWMMRCKDCGGEISVWDAGGVRYKAAGRPWRMRACAKCGRSTWHQVHWQEAAETASTR